MKRLFLTVIAALSLAFTACSDRSAGKAQPGQPKPVDRVVAAEADNLCSDAAFALQLRDFARVEQDMEKALKLRADIPEWWELLGYSCKMLDKTGDARSAYKKALALWEKNYDATNDVQAGMRYVYVLLLLDRTSEARSFSEELAKKHQEDKGLMAFVRNKGIDQMLADPELQKKKL